MQLNENLFFFKLRGYKAKNLHPDCEVIKKKKFDMAKREIINTIEDARYNGRQALYHVKEILNELGGE